MDKEKNEHFIIGRNVVLEALRAHYPIKLLVVSENATLKDHIMESILSLARRNNIQVLFREKNWFDRRFKILNHQGVVAVGAKFVYQDINELKLKRIASFLYLTHTGPSEFWRNYTYCRVCWRKGYHYSG